MEQQNRSLHGLYSIYDTVAEIYSQPWLAPTAGVALRVFADIAADVKSDVCRHAADFVLHKVGDFDLLAGDLINHKSVEIAKALDLQPKNVSETTM